MQFFKFVLAAFCLSAFTGCSVNDPMDETAQANMSAPAQSPAAADAEGQYVDKVVCKRIVRTGSRTNGSKVCATVTEWEELSRESQEATNELSRRTGQQNRMEGQ